MTYFNLKYFTIFFFRYVNYCGTDEVKYRKCYTVDSRFSFFIPVCESDPLDINPVQSKNEEIKSLVPYFSTMYHVPALL